MNTQHTPGPWGFDTVSTSCGICHRIGPFPAKREGDKPKHACVYVDYPSPGGPWELQMEANARLIAAAPDLLEALKRTLKHIKWEAASADEVTAGCREDIAQAEAAIAKATGASQ